MLHPSHALLELVVKFVGEYRVQKVRNHKYIVLQEWYIDYGGELPDQYMSQRVATAKTRTEAEQKMREIIIQRVKETMANDRPQSGI